jgi:putative ABC transport system ATP-binding protein
MLTASDLRKEFESYGEVVSAVDGVTLSIDDGVFAAIVGPSGSGKSTLLSLLGALDTPTSGTIRIGGEDVTAMSERELTAYRRNRIGFVFQSYNLVPNLSALQNVMLPMEFAGMARQARHARAAKLLDQVGLSGGKQQRRPGRLSGGEQQRVAIARALANSPCLILADEPTGNLDSETGEIIVELLHDLAKSENTTVIAVTHDTEIAEKADIAFQLRDGRLGEPFFKIAERADAAYETWQAKPDDRAAEAFMTALRQLINAAPSHRRLSPKKIGDRYPEAHAIGAFAQLLVEIEDEDRG